MVWRQETVINNNASVSLYSFDIFDTLVTRTTATPKGIFAIMQNTLKKDKNFAGFPSILKENFYTLRIDTECFIRENRQNYKVNEITIDEIYDFIKENNFLTDEQKEKLLKLELDSERKNLIPINENISKLKNLIQQGKRVVLISDMYLSKNFVQSVLTGIDEIFKSIKIYISSEIKEQKYSGLLFKYVKDKENVEFKNWYHYGDNQRGDVEIPKSLGINTIKYDYEPLLPYESEILLRYPDDAYISLSVGTAKNCRLFNKKADSKFNLGVSLGAPCLYPYIDWIIKQTKFQKFNRLYFVMRDGEVLRELTDILAQKNNLDIETKLIYGSRESWRAASITEKNPDFAFMFASKREINTIRKISARFHVPLDKLLKLIPNEFNNVDKTFDDLEFDKIKTFLLSSAEFLKLVEEENKEQRELIKEYIKQEMDLSDNLFAIVDLAASGRTQMCFVNIINEIKDIIINGFYAQFNGLKINAPKFNMKAFYTTPKVKSWFELFCRSECGYTKKYINQNGKIYPVLEELEGKALKKYGYSKVMDGQKLFVNNFYDALKRNELVAINYKQFVFYLDYIANRPDKNLADLIGDMPFSNYYGLKDKVYYCAPKITLKMLLLGYDKTQIQLPKLSYIRSSKTIKRILNFKNKYGSLRKFLIHIYFSKRRREFYIRFFGIKVNHHW